MAKTRACGLSTNNEISMAAMITNVKSIRLRSQRARPRCLSVEVAAKFVAMAPTTPTAYRSAGISKIKHVWPAMSLTAITSIIGIKVAAIIPAAGTPNVFNF